ncbi:aldehyde dehydrogenase family protein [Azoarcus sp. DD4]|uniref:L-piperidine-6-carboxylate dehydrogenase n=1 Tax=Azoarcus sp. DD4 TaxID=2027405 RepID=UPI00143DAF27|nr:aldehyde dehydrogenase family protein [Azoarcus sp. DD4]
MDVDTLLARLGLATEKLHSGDFVVRTPITGAPLVRLQATRSVEAEAAIARASHAYLYWRTVPAPVRGTLVRRYADTLHKHKTQLAELITLESGKIHEEALGEVQEMIDICEFAAGLSRQLHGLTITSERPGHRIQELWHPAGVVGIISAFNFPAAVWAWNAALAWVCGDTVVWKPSERTPLTALACASLFSDTCASQGDVCEGLLEVLVGGRSLAELLATDKRIAVLSATGSCEMGQAIAPVVARRMGKAILELGGNNAAIVTPSADLALTERAVLFGAVGTAGQRCTSLRRLIVHDAIHDTLRDRLRAAWQRVKVGNPLLPGVLVGPLIDQRADDAMSTALLAAEAAGGIVWGGETVAVEGCSGAYYRRPALVEMPAQTDIMMRETFAPILYLLRYRDLREAITLNNAVPQGLASAIFTRDLAEAELFMSAAGSDCGIVNVNTGPSGAEIGGAFGGEKDSGGGREAGSDAWKAYMRRTTCTVNASGSLPLAQGISFGLETQD